MLCVVSVGAFDLLCEDAAAGRLIESEGALPYTAQLELGKCGKRQHWCGTTSIPEYSAPLRSQVGGGGESLPTRAELAIASRHRDLKQMFDASIIFVVIG